MLSSLKGKEKDVSKKTFSIYIASLTPKTQRGLEDRELNQARSKPDTVNRPVRTARIVVHQYNSTQYCNTESFYLYSPSSRPTSHLRCGQLEVRGDQQQSLFHIENKTTVNYWSLAKGGDFHANLPLFAVFIQLL